MADVVDGHQVLGRIIGLEVADARVLGRFLKQGLVAVGKRRAALGQCFAHAIDGMRREHVVVVGKGQILPAASFAASFVLAAMPLFSILA